MVDVLALLPTSLAIGSDTPAPIHLYGGGSAANTAAWLVQAGAVTTFVGRIGDDVLGRAALDELAGAGVELVVSVDPVRPTGTCIVLVDATGERTMVPAAGANSGLGEAPLPNDLISPGTHLHVSAYAVFNPGALPAADALIAQAIARGASISVDAASSAPLAEFGAERFLGWLSTAGPDALLFANLDEAEALGGRHESVEETARLLGARCGAVVVKRGRDGAVWSDGAQVVSIPTQPVTAVDSTGAGDAFAAGMLAALLGGEPVDSALGAANSLARRAITRLGARPTPSPHSTPRARPVQ
jgi:sugar/nucleoside kinase (ribokinase family)